MDDNGRAGFAEPQKLYLTKISTYGALYENVLIGKSGSFNLSTVLDEHEVRLILLEKR